MKKRIVTCKRVLMLTAAVVFVLAASWGYSAWWFWNIGHRVEFALLTCNNSHVPLEYRIPSAEAKLIFNRLVKASTTREWVVKNIRPALSMSLYDREHECICVLIMNYPCCRESVGRQIVDDICSKQSLYGDRIEINSIVISKSMVVTKPENRCQRTFK